MSEDQPPASNQTPDNSTPEAPAPSKKSRTLVFTLQLLLIAIKGLIVFLLLFGGANPAVLYQKF